MFDRRVPTNPPFAGFLVGPFRRLRVFGCLWSSLRPSMPSSVGSVGRSANVQAVPIKRAASSAPASSRSSTKRGHSIILVGLWFVGCVRCRLRFVAVRVRSLIRRSEFQYGGAVCREEHEPRSHRAHYVRHTKAHRRNTNFIRQSSGMSGGRFGEPVLSAAMIYGAAPGRDLSRCGGIYGPDATSNPVFEMVAVISSSRKASTKFVKCFVNRPGQSADAIDSIGPESLDEAIPDLAESVPPPLGGRPHHRRAAPRHPTR